MSKHTPGPWTFREPDTDQEWDDDVPDYVTIHDANGVYFADVHRLTKDVGQEVMNRAELVAAAPELLEALQHAEEALSEQEAFTALAIIREAIVKAEGK